MSIAFTKHGTQLEASVHKLINIIAALIMFFIAFPRVAAAYDLQGRGTIPILEQLIQAMAQKGLPGGCTSQNETRTGPEFLFRIRNDAAAASVTMLVDKFYRRVYIDVEDVPDSPTVRIRLRTMRAMDAPEELMLADIERDTNRIRYLIAVDQNGAVVCPMD